MTPMTPPDNDQNPHAHGHTNDNPKWVKEEIELGNALIPEWRANASWFKKAWWIAKTAWFVCSALCAGFKDVLDGIRGPKSYEEESREKDGRPKK